MHFYGCVDFEQEHSGNGLQCTELDQSVQCAYPLQQLYEEIL